MLRILVVALAILLIVVAVIGAVNRPTHGNYQSAELVALVALAVILIGLFFVTGATLSMKPEAGAPPTWATGLLWSFACLAVGGLLGFIFGVPRAPTLTSLTEPKYSRPRPTGATGGSGASGPTGATGSSASTGGSGGGSTETPYQPNSNLEEISDWLTKILVGMGLSQWPAIKTQLKTIMTLLANGIGGEKAQPLALGIVMYFGTIGFLAVYLLTRLFISSALEATGG